MQKISPSQSLFCEWRARARRKRAPLRRNAMDSPHLWPKRAGHDAPSHAQALPNSISQRLSKRLQGSTKILCKIQPLNQARKRANPIDMPDGKDARARLGVCMPKRGQWN